MSLTNPHAVELEFELAWPPQQWRGSHVLLAVSGGADSVAMLRAAIAIKASVGGDGRLFAAHLNHGLRSTESSADEEWVVALCRRLGVPLITETIDVASAAESAGDGVEAAAREARYEFLLRVAERLGARFVVVAHTADDHVETVLHRIIRGTGIAGLRGIPPTRPLSPSVMLVRPLLRTARRDVVDYLTSLGQDFRTDASNRDLQFTRNRLRHELLPAMREHYNAEVDAAIIRLAAQAAETQVVIEALVSELSKQAVSVERAPRELPNTPRMAQRIEVDCPILSGHPPLIIRELLRAAWDEASWPKQSMGFAEWEQLASLTRGAGASRLINLPGNLRAHREGAMLIVESISLP
jgi:tRNA(Ile)-lysidine synthase